MELTVLAKTMSYRDRTYPVMLEAARALRLPEREIALLEAWPPTGAVDQKREDALLMLRVIHERVKQGMSPGDV